MMVNSAGTIRNLTFLVAVIGAGLLYGDLSEPGPFETGSTTVTISRPDQSTFTALLYYPSDTGGPDSPFYPGGGPYSAITFGHGFLQQPSRYFGTLEHLASYGHLVVASTSETGLFPNHAQFADDMRLTLDYLSARNNDPNDPFYRQVETSRFGLFGHSMGGGAGLLAAVEDPRIKAVAGLATAITNPSPEPLIQQIQAPVSLLSGDEDGIVPYEMATLPLYEASTAPKLQPLILGGCHVGFQDDPFPIFGDSGSLPADQQLAFTRAYLTSYFGLYLRGDQAMWRNIWGPEVFSDAGILTMHDPGVDLVVGGAVQSIVVGQRAIFEISVTNTGPEPNWFEFFTEDNTWGAVLGAGQTPVLAPAEQFVLELEISVPPDVAAGSGDSLLLSARSDNDGGTRGYLLLNMLALEAADFDASGNVDINDFLVWQDGFGVQDSATHGQGDADLDGDVDGADFLSWQRGFGASGGGAASIHTVPEPGAFLLTLMFLVCGPLVREKTSASI